MWAQNRLEIHFETHTDTSFHHGYHIHTANPSALPTPIHPTPCLYILPLPSSIGWLLQVTNQWRHLVSILHGGSMQHLFLFLVLQVCGVSWLYVIHITAADAACFDLWNCCRPGSTRFMSPPMVSSQLVLSRLYAIHVAADDIHDLICKISFVFGSTRSISPPRTYHPVYKIVVWQALRDSYRCRCIVV
jgi:hypothetical protein